MASAKQAGGLHGANDRNGHDWKKEVFKKCLEDLKRSKRIHEGQRGVKLCLEMFNDAHTKYDNDSDLGPFVADLIVHLTKELKEKAVEQHAFVKRNEELLKINQKLQQQLASQLAESSTGESNSDELETKQKHIWQLRWQNKTACKAFDGKEFAHVEELKRKSQVKRKEVAKKKKALTDLKCKLENENNPDNMCILQNKIKNVLAVVLKADADEDNLFKQARERMNDLQTKTLSQVVKQSKRLRDAEGKVKEGAKKIKEGYAAIQKGTQFIHSPGDTAFETLAGVV